MNSLYCYKSLLVPELTVSVEDKMAKWLPLDRNVIKLRAFKIFNYLTERRQWNNAGSHQSMARNGWFAKFKKRHALHNLKIQSDRSSADADAANKQQS